MFGWNVFVYTDNASRTENQRAEERRRPASRAESPVRLRRLGVSGGVKRRITDGSS